MSEFLILKNITKKFSNTIANDNITLSINKGEIHAVLGENGAGKTTLMNIIYGLYEPDKGEIWINDKKIKLKSPQDAISLGIGMVHQHFMLIPTFSILENIALGEKSLWPPFLNLNTIKNRLIEMKIHDLNINFDRPVWQLSVGEQQKVEILKTLYHGAELLIFDEPTAVLTPKETEEFFLFIKSLKEKGHSVIFITHKLKEIMNISDKVTVLRDGKKIRTLNTGETDENTLAKMMIGRDMNITLDKKSYTSDKEVVLKLKALSVMDDRKLMAIKDVNFTVNKGEIFGIAGVDGNGQRELAETITGMRKALKGQIFINNKDITNSSPEKIISSNTSHIPEDRQSTGAIMNFTIRENSILGLSDFMKGFLLNYKKSEECAEKIIKDYDIKSGSIEDPASSLSGGNLQKLVIGRELSREPDLIIAVHPTRGLDLGSVEYVHKTLIQERERGAAILLISTDLNELLILSDVIGVIYKGIILGQFSGKEINMEKIGLLMAGKST